MSANTNHDILSVIIAHNELEYVKRNVQILLEELKDTASGIVVVDNHSNDGVGEWLSEQNEISSIGNCQDTVWLWKGYYAVTGKLFFDAGQHCAHERSVAQPGGNCGGGTDVRLLYRRAEGICRKFL